jgi:transposase
MVCTTTVSSRGVFPVDGSARGEDFYLATRGDFYLATRGDMNLATCGDFFMATDTAFCASVRVVATDLAESYRAGTSPFLDHAIRVADPFHVVRVANRCVDKVRRRVQNETTGHYAGNRCQEACSSSRSSSPSKTF